MRILRAVYDERPGEVAARLACPVLYALARPRRGAGEDERGFYEMKRAAARRLRPLAPRVRVTWLVSMHDVPLERPAELARLIASFARRAGPGPRRPGGGDAPSRTKRARVRTDMSRPSAGSALACLAGETRARGGLHGPVGNDAAVHLLAEGLDCIHVDDLAGGG